MNDRTSHIPHLTSPAVVYETDFPALKLLRRGKVRDIYDLGEYLLIVATDRLSAFDAVMPQPIPYKGKVLNQLSNFWFEVMKPVIPNHIVATNVDEFPKECLPYRDQLHGRSIVVKKAKPLVVECAVRGYLAGSGWDEYRRSKSILGLPLPDGLEESAKLAEPIFTPSTKADVGDDENISFEDVVGLIGKHYAERVKFVSLQIYRKACEVAEPRGMIIADTKMEFGIFNNELILIDELLTPDSSRFWSAASYKPGVAQENVEKQFVYDYLLSINFNKRPPAPQLPEEVIQKTSELYREALKRLTGKVVD